MNAVCNLKLDQSSDTFAHDQQSASLTLNMTGENLNLIDIWWFQNLGIQDYTFLCKSWIIFKDWPFSAISQSPPAALADHNPLVLSIDLSFKIKRSQRWGFNTLLLNDTNFNSEFRTRISSFLDDNKSSVADARFVWMATKGLIRDFTISYMSHLKKARNLRVKELEEKCLCLEKTRKERYSSTVKEELQVTRQELNDLLRRQAEFIIHRTRKNYYCNGSKPSQLLALKLKQSEFKASTDSIRYPTIGGITWM